MHAQPLISIVIPAFNAAQWIEATLRSCFAQSYERFEVIVVDDGSTDATADIVRQLAASEPARLRLVQSEHRGLGGARNVGVRHSQGSWLCYLDADDLVEPDALRQAIELAEATNAQAVVGGWHNFTQDPRHAVSTHIHPFGYPEDPVASVILRPVVCSAGLFSRTDVLWDEALVSWEGVRYFMDVLPRFQRIVHLPIAMARIRQHADSERLTIKYDHFEPGKAMRFYADLKRRMTRQGFITALRAEAIDYHLLHYAYAARRRGIRDLSPGCDAIDARRLRAYRWYRRLALPAVAALLGPRWGVEAFYLVNRALRRA